MLEIRGKGFGKELVESKWKCWVCCCLSLFSLCPTSYPSGNLRVDHFLSRLYDSVNRNLWLSLVIHANPSVSKRGICAVFVISAVYGFHPAQKTLPTLLWTFNPKIYFGFWLILVIVVLKLLAFQAFQHHNKYYFISLSRGLFWISVFGTSSEVCYGYLVFAT